MASAVLVSRNEPSWGESKVYIRKYPNTVATAAIVSNDSALFKAKSHRNPNPYRQNHVRHSSIGIHVKDNSSLLPLSTDSALLRWKPMASNENLESSRVGHVTYKLGGCTRRELKHLKKRLLVELEQVRILRTRIESMNFGARFDYPPPPALQVVHDTDLQQPSGICTPKGRKKGRGSKRVNPFGTSRKNPKRIAMEPPAENVVSGMMKRCRQILGKLMKYKHGWVFNTPVDVVGLGLHDYKEIIKTPMDLGTVKSNLDKNVYKSPLEFAADVRLTFSNALKYNPRGHEVYSMAETLLAKFDGMFNPVFGKIEENSENVNHVPAIEAKLPKPKVKEVKRRKMSKEEKKTLGSGLVNLPNDKMVKILDILKKRNSSLGRDGDEIVLDIEVLDEETLWELDGFVSKYKISDNVGQGANEKVSGRREEEEAVQLSKKVEDGEEDVDIGEEIPAEYYPPVVIERDVNGAAHTDTSTSSSSGTDTSASGSDSGSSSSSDEDDEDAVQSKDDAHET